jgi:hypothetical protein
MLTIKIFGLLSYKITKIVAYLLQYFSVTKGNLKVGGVLDFGHFKNVQNQKVEKSLEKCK